MVADRESRDRRNLGRNPASNRLAHDREGEPAVHDHARKALVHHVLVIPVLAREITGGAGVPHELLGIDAALEQRHVAAGLDFLK